MADKKNSVDHTAKQCRICRQFFPTGFNRHWTRSKRAILCATKFCGAVFRDRLDYYAHHRSRHGSPAPQAQQFKPTPWLCSPQWQEAYSRLNILNMPEDKPIPADDILGDPLLNVRLNISPAESPSDTPYDSADDDTRIVTQGETKAPSPKKARP